MIKTLKALTKSTTFIKNRLQIDLDDNNVNINKYNDDDKENNIFNIILPLKNTVITNQKNKSKKEKIYRKLKRMNALKNLINTTNNNGIMAIIFPENKFTIHDRFMIHDYDSYLKTKHNFTLENNNINSYMLTNLNHPDLIQLNINDLNDNEEMLLNNLED